MKSGDTVHLLRTHGVNTGLSYKIKDRTHDLIVFRHDGDHWFMPLLEPGDHYDAADVLAILTVAVASGMVVTVFDCCCAACLPQSKREWTWGYFKRTGLRVSHGYWPECAEKARAEF